MGMGFVVVIPEAKAKSAAKMLGGKVIGEIVNEGIRVKGLEIK